jgi:hypothetical protein
VLAYSINTNGVDRIYFNYYSFNGNQTWLANIRLSASPYGISENGTTVDYDDSVDESMVTVTFVGTNFVFAWQYNKTILYRTWSSTAGAAQIYVVSVYIYIIFSNVNKALMLQDNPREYPCKFHQIGSSWYNCRFATLRWFFIFYCPVLLQSLPDDWQFRSIWTTCHSPSKFLIFYFS